MSRLKDFSIKGEKEYEKATAERKAAVERNLQLISDIELDVLILLDRHLGLGTVADEESIVDRFEGRMRKETLEKLRERRKLRNTLIHAYAVNRDDKEVGGQAINLDDVKRFASEVRKLISEKQ
jgi:uncharacterized protein YutE (UPF0331/DUF86 family)